MIECRVCGGPVTERCCDHCGRVMSSEELLLALTPLHPAVRRAEADRADFAEREA